MCSFFLDKRINHRIPNASIWFHASVMTHAVVAMGICTRMALSMLWNRVGCGVYIWQILLFEFRIAFFVALPKYIPHS